MQFFVWYINPLEPAKLKKKTCHCRDIMCFQTVAGLLYTTSTVTPGLPAQDTVNAIPDVENWLPQPQKNKPFRNYGQREIFGQKPKQTNPHHLKVNI